MLFLLCFFTPVAQASGPDPLTGVRVSLLGLQTILSAPPLPDLHDSTKRQLQVQGSYLIANVNDTEDFGGGATLTSNGSFKGGAAGLGYSSPTDHRIGFFIFGTGDSLSGNIKLLQFGSTINLANMKNSGATVSTGASFRLWSEAHFPIAVGVFTGPTLSYLSSTFDVQDASGNTVGGHYTSHPISYGGMAGAQAGLTLFSVYLNPYFIYYKDATNGCKSFEMTGATAGTVPSECSEGSNYIKIPLSFAAYGINVGIWRFFFNAYAHLGKDSSMNSIDLHNYQLSYSVDF